MLGGSQDETEKTAQDLTSQISTLEKRVKSIQTEVNIEARILDGLLKMGQAKALMKETKKKKVIPVQEPDMHEQIEKSSRKLELFRNEMIKCQQQIDVLKAETAAISARELKMVASYSVDLKHQLSREVCLL